MQTIVVAATAGADEPRVADAAAEPAGQTDACARVVGDAGPAIILSFVPAGVTCVFSALAYAEPASTIPVSGSAYTYDGVRNSRLRQGGAAHTEAELR